LRPRRSEEVLKRRRHFQCQVDDFSRKSSLTQDDVDTVIHTSRGEPSFLTPDRTNLDPGFGVKVSS
jgi:hypothetical protein